MQVISLGGGIQSTTLVLMSILGEISPPAEFAIFADTQWERRETYGNIDWLTDYAKECGFPIHRVSAGNIRNDMLSTDKGHYDHIPLYTDSGKERAGQLRRQCTAHYKIAPIRRELRRLFGFQKFSLWIGFSVDETIRMKPSDVKYITHRYPLIEKRMGRDSCVKWLTRHGFPVPQKSACVGCPYRTNAEWEEMQQTSPDEFDDACGFDEAIRNKHLHKSRRRDYPLYLHERLQPLREIEFANPDQLSLFGEQICGGGCFL